MSTFGQILKSYREGAGLSQNELAGRAGLSVSTISRVEKGERGPLRKRSQVMALAKALGLKQEETDLLLSAAALAPSAATELSLHPRDETLYKIAQELEALRTDPSVTPTQVRFVEEALLLVLRGVRAALPQANLPALPAGAPVADRMSEEERYLDDLLGDLLRAGGGAPPGGGPPSGALPFAILNAAARSPRWELKRRLAEALPAMLQMDVERALALVSSLREDPPDPEWRTDIRRRVIEAAPVLWKVRPEQVAPLLRWRAGDEVYAALAALDALADIGDAELSAGVQDEVLDCVEEEHQRAVTLYARLLDQCAADPDGAIQTIQQHRDDEERLVRVCMARPLHRLLPHRSAETLQLMRHVLRQEGGQPVEHQNVRRALARHAGQLIALLGGPDGSPIRYDEGALALLHILIADRDVHIRRAVCDALSALAERLPEITLDLIEEHLLQDRDKFVHERTWNVLRYLVKGGSERAEELCARMIEIA